jgi:tetratricopeptide (TPR) repeat protein
MAQERFPWRLTAVVVGVVVLVTGTSFGISRMFVNQAIDEGRPIAERRAEQRKLQAEAATQQEALSNRAAQLSGLLLEVEDKLEQSPLDSMLVVSAANLAYELQQYQKAEVYYKRFLDKIDPANSSVGIDYAFVVFQNGRPQDGLGILKQIIRREPGNQLALYNCAYLYMQLGDNAKAAEMLTACRNVNPATPTGQNAERALEQITATENQQIAK